FAFGFGAHFDPKVALKKALMEMTQFLPVIISGRDPGCFLRTENGQTDLSFVAPDERVAKRYHDFPSPVARNVQEDVLLCAKLAQSWGLDMLVLEQTRKHVGMPVVKILVPGMRSWWARFAPGRLYTLPIQLGWLATPRTEAALNPDHLIL